ncbi:SDR family oxidoreductase [Chitinophaga horti]|uniref:SDR family oxidoreductase n=1 Tax=Chitinophaga horti TaxID=2920382 RepID=A0ABY6JBT9_9BACT|nr:SDR family oxidoreductase [Chitinophaga horti]UYQ95774.1 SDR family oxidoreductase [Chitinophaga horti]
MNKILITGASRGIGAATALLAARHGLTVIVNYHRNQAAADKVVQTIMDSGGKALAVQADVSAEADILRLFEACDRLPGTLSALVNNAGILETQMRLDQMDTARIQRILTANVTGSLLCAREAIKRMSTRYGGEGGAIVNVSSVAARTGAPGEYIDYAASKGAIDAFTIGLSKEVAAEGIRVNGVRPGFIHTDIHADGGEPGRVERLRTSIPMQRGGTAEEIADIIWWLCSAQSTYVTGAIVDAAGGR